MNKKKMTRQERLLQKGRKRVGFLRLFAARAVVMLVIMAIVWLVCFELYTGYIISTYTQEEISMLTSLESSVAAAYENYGDQYEDYLHYYTATHTGNYNYGSIKSETAMAIFDTATEEQITGLKHETYCFITGEKDGPIVCPVAEGSFDEVDAELEMLTEQFADGKNKTVFLMGNTAWVDESAGVAYPGEIIFLLEDFSPSEEIESTPIDTVDFSPEDTSSLKEYTNVNFMSYIDSPDNRAIETLNGFWYCDIDQIYQYSSAKPLDMNTQVIQLQNTITVSSGKSYTIRYVCIYDFSDMFASIAKLWGIFAAAAALIIALFLAMRTNYIYKSHYAMEDYRRQMTNSMAHDLKTPLMAISGYAENLKLATDDAKLGHYADSILRNVNNMDEIIRNVLELAELEGGKSPERQPVEMQELISKLIGEYEPVLEESKLTVSLSGTAGISADPNRMERLVTNLLSNAIDHTPEGDEIKITLDPKSMTIENPCTFMPEIDVKELTKPFVKGIGSRGKKGSGLGLSIVQNICDSHGFTLSISAENNKFTAVVKFS